LHSRNILYRDAKPSNLLWDDRKLKATIIDFDVATFFDRKNLHRRHVGTEGYMAYEQDVVHDAEKAGKKPPIRGYDLRADIYSAGVVFGQLLYEIEEENVTDDETAMTSARGMVAMTHSIQETKYEQADLRHYRIGGSKDSQSDEEEEMTDDVLQEEKQALIYAHELLLRMLEKDPDNRITIEDALKHPYFSAPLPAAKPCKRHRIPKEE